MFHNMCKMCVEKNNDQFQTLEIGWHKAESILPLGEKSSTRILELIPPSRVW